MNSVGSVFKNLGKLTCFYASVSLGVIVAFVIGDLIWHYWNSLPFTLATVFLGVVTGMNPEWFRFIEITSKSLAAIVWFAGVMFLFSRLCPPPGPIFRWSDKG